MAGDDQNPVLVDGLSPVTAKSEGTVVGFADVCKVPGPTGPVPIPFPNVARSKDLQKGSKTVSINGAPVCLKDSCLGTSTGNEAAMAGGGVVSGKTRGAAHPVNYSFSVRIEGKPVVRSLDLFTLNDRNTPPFPIMQSQVTRPVAGRVEEREVARRVETCPYCKLDELSTEILGKVARFMWTLTRDGLDYQEGGVGCAGVTRIPEKPDQRCPKQRRHHLTHAASGLPLAGRALKVGE